jgi:hypothetical protein
MSQTLSAKTTAAPNVRGLHGTSAIRVHATPSGLWNTALMLWPELS